MKLNSVSTFIREVHSLSQKESRILFDNEGAKMISGSRESFFGCHTPILPYLRQLQVQDKLKDLLEIFKNLNVPDASMMMGAYNSTMNHRTAGGSYESIQNELARIRVWANEIIHKLESKGIPFNW